MRILFSNEKGGVGKSTHCTMFANYLCSLGKSVRVYDLDKQRTIDRMRDLDEKQRISSIREEEENTFDNPLNFEVSYWSLDDDMHRLLENTTDEDVYYLFDTPANIDNRNVLVLMVNADYIIIPFDYERTVLDSTALLLQIVTSIKTSAKLVFIPNRIKSGIRIDSIKEIDERLSSIGLVTPIVPDRVDIRRYSTLFISDAQRELLAPVYDSILKLFEC